MANLEPGGEAYYKFEDFQEDEDQENIEVSHRQLRMSNQTVCKSATKNTAKKSKKDKMFGGINRKLITTVKNKLQSPNQNSTVKKAKIS